jgi:hypothetical protein
MDWRLPRLALCAPSVASVSSVVSLVEWCRTLCPLCRCVELWRPDGGVQHRDTEGGRATEKTGGGSRGRLACDARPLKPARSVPLGQCFLASLWPLCPAFCTLRVVHSPQRTQRPQRGHRAETTDRMRQDPRRIAVCADDLDRRSSAPSLIRACMTSSIARALKAADGLETSSSRPLCPLCGLCVLCGESGRMVQNPVSSVPLC